MNNGHVFPKVQNIVRVLLPTVCQGMQRVPLSHLKTPQTHDPPWFHKGLLATANFLKLNGALMSNSRPYSSTALPSIPVKT